MSTTENVYQFKITLKHLKPKIWRRIQVPQKYSFADLHVAIQDAMGWSDSHLHQFRMKSPMTGMEVTIGIYNTCVFFEEMKAETEAEIMNYFTPVSRTATYEYDLGFSWMHEIFLEKILPAKPGVSYPKCLAGRRACPPEDPEEDKEDEEWLRSESASFDPASVTFNDPKESYKF